MKWLGDSGITVALAGFCILLLVCGGNAEADFRFGSATNLGTPINSGYRDQPVGITADGLSLYFASTRPGGQSEWWDIWVATRPTKDDPWGEPVNLGPPVNTDHSEETNDISADGLTLYIRRVGPGGHPNWDIWVSTRATTNDPWCTPVNLGPPVNTLVADMDPSISSDGLTLYFSSERPGGQGEGDIWMATRPTKDHPWSEPVNFYPPVNGAFYDEGPEIAPDDLTLFFASNRPGGFGSHDLYVMTRATVNDPWSEPVNLGPGVNSPSVEHQARVSADGTLLLFESNRPGGMGEDIWQAPIIPIVDFNGDETVNIEDLLMLIGSWGQNDPSVDIGPTPLGDGVVDAADLEVLMAYWGQKPPDPSLIAHWKLDESEGMTAHDSVGVNDGTVMGAVVWQPDGGYVDGALELNGTTFIMGSLVLNPADGPFSVLAWVKGGLPGQGVITQQGGVDWLHVDAAEGKLTTDLSGSLCSQTVITDGDWHRVGVTWDGSACLLYVDDILEAESVEGGLASSTGRVVIGCRRIMTPGTFWTGLIDDVRIYNRAVKP